MAFNLPEGVRVAVNGPIDSDRYIADTIANRDSLITNGRAQESQQVYVKSDKTLYVLKGATNDDWEKIGGNFIPLSGYSESGTPTSGITVSIGDNNNLNSGTKIIVGGAFSSYSGSSVNDIVRLNSDGTSDTSSISEYFKSPIVASTGNFQEVLDINIDENDNTLKLYFNNYVDRVILDYKLIKVFSGNVN